MGELLEEAGRGLGALFSDELLLTALAAVVVVAAVVLASRRAGVAAGGWPLVVVAAVALGVRERAVVPLAVAGIAWLALERIDAAPPSRPRWVLGALGVTALGLFGTLPETQEAVALVAATTVVAIAGAVRLVDLDRVTGAQVGALLGLLVWVCLAGDGQRGRALLAGLLCLGMFAVVTALLDRGTAGPLALHAVVTVAASRWVGLAPDLAGASVRAVPVLLVAGAGTVVVLRRGSS